MPNRDLKESNRRSPSLQVLSDAAERLWYRLLTAVDDFGRLEACPEVVFTTCFQRVPKGWTIEKVKRCLIELVTVFPDGDQPLLRFYKSDNRIYLQVMSAKRHIQQRAKMSKYPSPTDSELNQYVTAKCAQTRADAGGCEQIPSYPVSRIPYPDLRIPYPERREDMSSKGAGAPDVCAYRNYLDEAKEVLKFLNEKTGKKFREVPATLVFIEARLKSGVEVQDCRTLIARKVRDWGTDPKMMKYLRPETLFNQTKFETYLAEVST